MGLAIGGVTGGPVGAGVGFAIGCGVSLAATYDEEHDLNGLGQATEGTEYFRSLAQIFEYFDE